MAFTVNAMLSSGIICGQPLTVTFWRALNGQKIMMSSFRQTSIISLVIAIDKSLFLIDPITQPTSH